MNTPLPPLVALAIDGLCFAVTAGDIPAARCWLSLASDAWADAHGDVPVTPAAWDRVRAIVLQHEALVERFPQLLAWESGKPPAGE